MPQLLLVEPNDAIADRLARNAAAVADVRRQRDFETARREVTAVPFALLATNLRLGPFNGLHLVYLAATAGIRSRAIVYTNDYDPALAEQVQRAGAFYETGPCLERALGAYLKNTLPPEDRRNPFVRDRRRLVRGGRRCWDSIDAER